MEKIFSFTRFLKITFQKIKSSKTDQLLLEYDYFYANFKGLTHWVNFSNILRIHMKYVSKTNFVIAIKELIFLDIFMHQT